jgi:hypothetical protein
MTLICNDIRNLSTGLWHYLTDVFRFQLRASEIGITNHLVYFITSFYSGRIPGIEVYTFNAKHEKLRGADIDLFIQLPNGLYRFYMLQAKVSGYNGKYLDIEQWTPNAQYNTLLSRAKLEGASPYYLLYTGNTPLSNLSSSDYGLACIHANTIAKIKLSYHKKTAGTKATIDLNTLRSYRLFPFHHLFCRTPSPFFHSKRMEHDGSQIFTGFPYIQLGRDISNGKNDEQEVTLSDSEGLARYGTYRIIIKNQG